MPINKEGKIDKGWGYELIFASNDLYCGKIMVFNRKGAKFSMHYHAIKDESWFINNGKFLLSWIDTKDATLYTKELNEGDTWRNPPFLLIKYNVLLTMEVLLKLVLLMIPMTTIA